MRPPEIEDAIAEALVGAGVPGVISVYLFGSQAAGRTHRDSDIDVAVFFDRGAQPTPAGRFEARLRLTARFSAALRTPAVDLVVLNDSPPGLARRIVSAGRRLHCSDLEADHAFVRDTLLRAADLDPFLRRARRVKLAALARS